MRTLPLSASAQVVLDDNGDGFVEIGPEASGEIWPAGYNAGVRCSSNTAEAIAKVYCGGRFIGGSTWGSTGDASTDTAQVGVGQVVRAEWTGGDHGAIAYLDITGTKEVA